MPNDGHADTEARRNALRALLASADLSALLVTKPVNVSLPDRLHRQLRALLLLHDRTMFFTDGRYRHQAGGRGPGGRGRGGPRRPDRRRRRGRARRRQRPRLRAGRADLGRGPAAPPRPARPGRAAGAAPGRGAGREVKDERELAAMREAARSAARSWPGCSRACARGRDRAAGGGRPGAGHAPAGRRRPGLRQHRRLRGAGRRAPPPSRRPLLGAGDWVKLDFGGSVDGYCADMTRTVVLGSASQRQRDLYELVLGAQEAGLACLEAGSRPARSTGPAASRSPRPGSATRSRTRPATASASRSTRRPGCGPGPATGSPPAPRSRSSPGSTCPASAGSASRTWPSPAPAATSCSPPPPRSYWSCERTGEVRGTPGGAPVDQETLAELAERYFQVTMDGQPLRRHRVRRPGLGRPGPRPVGGGRGRHARRLGDLERRLAGIDATRLGPQTGSPWPCWPAVWPTAGPSWPLAGPS